MIVTVEVGAPRPEDRVDEIDRCYDPILKAPADG